MKTKEQIWEMVQEACGEHEGTIAAFHRVKSWCSTVYPGFILSAVAAPTELRSSEIEAQISQIEPVDWSNYHRIIFAMVIDTGNDQQLWHVPIPRFDVFLSWPSSPFTPHNVQYFTRLHQVEKTILSMLPAFGDLNRDNAYLLVFLSVTTFGGLVERESLIHFLRTGPSSLVNEGNQLYIDVPPTAYEPPARGGTYRPLDPITLLLVIAPSNWDWCSIVDGLDKDNFLDCAWYRARALLVENGVPRRLLPYRVQEYLSMCTARLHFSMEPVLVNFAIGRLRSYARSSSPDELTAIEENLTKFIEPVRLSEIDDKLRSAATTTTDWSELDSALLKILPLQKSKDPASRKHGASLLSELVDQSPATDTIASAVPKWFKSRLSSATSNRRINAANTNYKRYHQGIRKLLELARDVSVDVLDISLLEKLYMAIVDEWPGIWSRSEIEKVFRAFHRFLVDHYWVAKVSSHALNRYSKMKRPVRAEYLSNAFIKAAQQHIRRDESMNEKEKAECLVIVNLLWKTSLRIDEVSSLRVSSFRFVKSPYLIIRSTSDDNLKTPTSNRFVPLSGLSGEELAELRKLVQKSAAESAQNTDPHVFGNSLDCNRKAFKDRVRKALSRALVKDSEKPSATPHTLRHSGPSNYLAEVLAKRYVDDPVLALGNVKQWDLTASANYFYALLRTESEDSVAQSPKLLRTVSQTLGHQDPSTTSENYIHTLHIAFAAALIRISPDELPTESLMGLLGVSESTVKRLRKEHREKGAATPFLAFLAAKKLEKWRRRPLRTSGAASKN